MDGNSEADRKYLAEITNKNTSFGASVLSSDQNNRFFATCKVHWLDARTPLLFENLYNSPDTLGKDRLANAAFLHAQKLNQPCVAIDLGTCIKFDFVDEKGRYHGGSISPGLSMRFEALNHFTGRLPRLQVNPAVLVGTDTHSSILSGVMQGFQDEIDSKMRRYEKDWGALTFFLTGGDAKHFDIGSKNNIFAVENLTLEGLFYLFKQYA